MGKLSGWSTNNMEMACKLIRLCLSNALYVYRGICWRYARLLNQYHRHQIGVPEWSQFNHKDPEMWAPRSCLWTVSVSPWYCTSGHSSYSVSQNIHPFEVPPFKEDDPKYFGKYTFLNFGYWKSKWGLHWLIWVSYLISKHLTAKVLLI